MQFIAASLGVECTFCHVQGKMDSDEKGAKKTARAMMAMQAEINKASFRGQKQVTCYSCHRGSQRPVNTPPVLESDAPARPAAPSPSASAQTVTADQILEKYVAAVGGADAIRKITTRVQTGKSSRAEMNLPSRYSPRRPICGSRLLTARAATASGLRRNRRADGQCRPSGANVARRIDNLRTDAELHWRCASGSFSRNFVAGAPKSAARRARY
jgi:hypothetical protein